MSDKEDKLSEEEMDKALSEIKAHTRSICDKCWWKSEDGQLYKEHKLKPFRLGWLLRIYNAVRTRGERCYMRDRKRRSHEDRFHFR